MVAHPHWEQASAIHRTVRFTWEGYPMERKKAAITGGEVGMGRGIALVLAEEGYDIAFSCYPNAERAESTVETMLSLLWERGAKGWPFPEDLSKPDEIGRAHV